MTQNEENDVADKAELLTKIDSIISDITLEIDSVKSLITDSESAKKLGIQKDKLQSAIKNNFQNKIQAQLASIKVSKTEE